MEWGVKQSYLDTLRRYGKPLPRDYTEPPVIRAHLQIVWDAFWELACDRQIGMATGPIPFASIDAYARRFEISASGLFSRFLAMIRAMDREFLAITAEAVKRAKEQTDRPPEDARAKKKRDLLRRQQQGD